MAYQFKIIPNDELDIIIPLVYELNESKVSKDLLKLRFNEMKNQNYECAGLFNGSFLIGVAGLWFCTRHYMGKSVELDHVYIMPEHRGKGLGKKFMDWINSYVKEKGCNAIVVNQKSEIHFNEVSVPLILVEDSREVLGAIAIFKGQQWNFKGQ